MLKLVQLAVLGLLLCGCVTDFTPTVMRGIRGRDALESIDRAWSTTEGSLVLQLDADLGTDSDGPVLIGLPAATLDAAHAGDGTFLLDRSTLNGPACSETVDTYVLVSAGLVLGDNALFGCLVPPNDRTQMVYFTPTTPSGPIRFLHVQGDRAESSSTLITLQHDPDAGSSAGLVLLPFAIVADTAIAIVHGVAWCLGGGSVSIAGGESTRASGPTYYVTGEDMERFGSRLEERRIEFSGVIALYDEGDDGRVLVRSDDGRYTVEFSCSDGWSQFFHGETAPDGLGAAFADGTLSVGTHVTLLCVPGSFDPDDRIARLQYVGEVRGAAFRFLNR